MAIIRWDPWGVTPRWFRHWPSLWDEEDWVEEAQGLTVYETDNDVVIKANMAGVPPKEIDVSLEGNTLTIKGEHKESEEEKKKKKVVWRQSRQAKYLYTTTLPCEVMVDKVRAEMTDGLLTVTAPKKAKVKPKKVKVATKVVKIKAKKK